MILRERRDDFRYGIRRMRNKHLEIRDATRRETAISPCFMKALLCVTSLSCIKFIAGVSGIYHQMRLPSAWSRSPARHTRKTDGHPLGVAACHFIGYVWEIGGARHAIFSGWVARAPWAWR
jgi:hypothetical protein